MSTEKRTIVGYDHLIELKRLPVVEELSLVTRKAVKALNKKAVDISVYGLSKGSYSNPPTKIEKI